MQIPANGNTRLGFGTFEVDLVRQELSRRGTPVHLQDKPFQILAFLLERPGEIVTREELQERLWPNGTFVEFDEGLNTAMKKLRQALLDSADSPIYIETLPRRGYRFITPVTVAFAEPNRSAGSVSEVDAAWRNGAVASNGTSEGAFGSKRGVLGRPSAVRYIAFATIVVVLAGIAIFARYRATVHTAAVGATGTRLTRITQNGNVREMAISPNGQYVTYAMREGLTQSLWIREVRSGNELQLLAPDTVNFSGLEFSPDGASVYFIRSEKTNPTFSYLCRMPSVGGSVEQLIRDADSPVSFSPGGKQFVYTRGYPRRDLTEVRLADRDGANDHVLLGLAGHQVYEAGATWSPNNRVVAVPIHIIGKESRFVLYAISLSGKHVKELYSSQGFIGRPLWLDSGKGLLMTVEDVSTHRGQLWTLSYPDGEARRFTNDLSDYSGAIDLTSDGTKLATIVTSVVANLWVANADDLSHATQVTSGEPSLFQVRELPDRRLLALGSGVWAMNDDASHRTRLGQVQDPRAIETCGSSVLLVGNKDGNAQLIRLGLDGSGATAIAGGDVLSPVCSPDEKFVYYLNFAHGEKIRRISVGDGTNSDIADIQGETVFGNLSISPDGNLLAYPYQQYVPPLVALAVVPSTGGAPIKQFQVPGFLGHVRWSPKGNALQYLQTREGATNLWEQRLEGGEPKQLTHFSVGQIFDFDWSHDGKRLLLTRGQMTRDVVLIENLEISH
jgi:DNA-binding winged helix-turn-helix (wHTH) protein/Tol biopolymer transport system component